MTQHFDLGPVRRALESGPIPPEIAALWASNGHNRYNPGRWTGPRMPIQRRETDDPSQFPTWLLRSGARIAFCGNWTGGRDWVRELYEGRRGNEAEFRRLYLGDWSAVEADALYVGGHRVPVRVDPRVPPDRFYLVQDYPADFGGV